VVGSITRTGLAQVLRDPRQASTNAN